MKKLFLSFVLLAAWGLGAHAAGGSPTHVLMVNSGTDKACKNQNVIFDMQGRKVGTKQEWESLPSGIYIIDGLKAVR